MSTITVADQAALVSSLAKGRTPKQVATHSRRPLDLVLEVARAHGWPDMGALERASEGLRDLLGGPPAAATTAQFDQLMGRAEATQSKRLMARAERIRDEITALADAITAWEQAYSAKHQAAAAAAQERERIRAQIAEHRAEIAKLQASFKIA